MVDVIGRAKVIITGDVDSRSIDKAGSTIGSKLKVGAAVGAAALGTLAVAGVKAFKAFEDGEAASAKLSTVLGNMGKQGAAESVEKLATSLQRATGFSDETIMAGQTLLATFSEVASSAGEAGGVFERASIAAVDLAAAGFGSVESSSKSLGKALQDPVKGITALGRAGVTFTQDQKDLIKSLVETGDVAGAQAIVLKEVEKQVGGVGEASKKESVLIGEAMGEIEQSAGQALAALLGDGKGSSLSGELFKVSDAISKLAKSKDWQTLGKNLRDTAKDTGTVASALFGAGKWAKNLTDKVPGLSEALGDLAAGPVWGSIDKLADLADAAKKAWTWLDKLGGELDGNSGVDINTGDNASGNRSFNINDLLASGGRSITGGMYVVGEEGPEIMRVPGGADVYSNRESAAMVGSSVTNNFILNGPNSLSEARRSADWETKYGTRFGAATNAGGM